MSLAEKAAAITAAASAGFVAFKGVAALFRSQGSCCPRCDRLRSGHRRGPVTFPRGSAGGGNLQVWDGT